jgi:signal transduction histidine kinase
VATIARPVPIVRARARALRVLIGRYGVELLWGAFATANYWAMIAWPSWETIPFHFIWISITLLYGFRVWPVRATLVVLTVVMSVTAVSIFIDAFNRTQEWGELFEVPLMAAMFLAMVWHARRRMVALRIVESQAEDRRALLEQQERFLHDASHELRTPVTIARGHLELLQGRRPGSSELAVALDELHRMDAIIERLLVLAAAGQPEFVQRQDIDVESYLEDVFMRWSELAPRAWRLGHLVPGRLEADPERLRAVLDALLENAVKYSGDQAAIELRTRELPGGRLAIEVADEGIGVPEEALRRIFERFGRAEPSRTRSAGGVGLGLAIVDAIVKAHGGRCLVRSTSGGSVFAIVLPRFGAAPMPPSGR